MDKSDQYPAGAQMLPIHWEQISVPRHPLPRAGIARAAIAGGTEAGSKFPRRSVCWLYHRRLLLCCWDALALLPCETGRLRDTHTGIGSGSERVLHVYGALPVQVVVKCPSTRQYGAGGTRSRYTVECSISRALSMLKVKALPPQNHDTHKG